MVLQESNGNNHEPSDPRVLPNSQQPAVIAAKAFFQGKGSKDWRSLPMRLERLSSFLESWVSDDYVVVYCASALLL